MADYWGHWLKVGRSTAAEKLPRIFQVNWFRKNADGKFIWPGFGENSRVLAWIIARLEGDVDAVETPIGRLPKREDLELAGLDISDEVITELFKVDAASWSAEADLTQEYFAQFGEHTPQELYRQLDGLKARLG